MDNEEYAIDLVLKIVRESFEKGKEVLKNLGITAEENSKIKLEVDTGKTSYNINQVENEIKML